MDQVRNLVEPIIKLQSAKLVLVSFFLVSLSIALPYLAHQFHLAGPMFLPLHFMALTAGLLLGWQAGLFVGLATPLMSFFFSGMPLPLLLPLMTLEIAVYGLVTGYLREKLKLNLYLSLLIALISGRTIWLIGLFITTGGLTKSVETIRAAATLGWPGLLLQLLIIPPLVIGLKKFYEKNSHQSG